MRYDVVIVGGGPAGLAAALTLGRACRRVLLCDAGSRRNAAAVHVHNFVTRDGVTPTEFRRTAREQLAPYAVEIRDERVLAITGERDRFDVRLEADSVQARRILLCTGMIDDLPEIEGVLELWGTSIFQCPYCHGWEIRNQRFAYLARDASALSFALLLRGWTNDVVAFTNGKFPIPDDDRAALVEGSVVIEERPIRRLTVRNDRLGHIEFTDGGPLERDALFMHPAQRQVEVVRALDLELDEKGFVQVDETTRQTPVPGIYAAGDIAAPVQGGQAAVLSAAAGMRAAAALNHELTRLLAGARWRSWP
jgi:thioredoxin reductase